MKVRIPWRGQEEEGFRDGAEPAQFAQGSGHGAGAGGQEKEKEAPRADPGHVNTA